jgi:predicted nucleotidyltransferase component of viral defense system
MKNKTVNIIASIHARLKSNADQNGQLFQEVLQYYGIERFLYRLSKTSYASDFILKGGLMFYGLGIPMRRPTKDIDFLGSGVSIEDISSIIKNVMSIQINDDGISFETNTLKIVRRQIDANHNGARVTFVGHLGNTRIPMQIDIGFSDELATTASKMDYPVLLSSMEKPLIRGYPLESIVSEKFHAIVRFAESNSRWKDYYDIWLLSSTFEFDSHQLEGAIVTTFETRSTKVPTIIPYGLKADFAAKNQESWRIFIHKSRLHNKDLEGFKIVVSKIWSFLDYPLQELQFDQQADSKCWKPNNGWV